MSSRNIGKRAVAKRKVNAPPRVYENIRGEVFSGPGIGSPWKMPIRFLEKTGTPIFVSLTGEGGRKAVFQRSNRVEWIKRLLATLAWKEVRIGLGYKDAVVWIGSKRFQPTSEDLKGFISQDEIAAVASGVRVSAPRKGKVRITEGDEEMAKKSRKVKKVKRTKNTGDGHGQGRGSAVTKRVRFLVERTKRGVVVTIDGRPKTKTLLTNSVLEESINAAAFGYTDKHIGPKEKIGNKGAGLYLRIRKAMGDAPGSRTGKRSGAKKISKKGQKGARKGVVKKVVKRPITKKSGRKVIHKVRR